MAKGKYNESLQELNRSNPKYMDDMKDVRQLPTLFLLPSNETVSLQVFDKCQAFEFDRLAKFKEFLASTEKCLDLSHRLQCVAKTLLVD